MRAFFASIFKLKYTNEFEYGALYFFVMFFFLALTVFTALRYLPLDNIDVFNSDTIVKYDTQNNNEYYIRVYGKNTNYNSNVILAVPPVLGSASIIDEVCKALAQDGGIVVSFSRKGLDFPAFCKEKGSLYPSLAVTKKMVSSLTSGWKDEISNANGQFFETERMKDIMFMLPLIEKEFNIVSDSIYILGYGAGGSALIMLSSSNEFTQKFPSVKGGIAVESKLFSFYETQRNTSFNNNSAKDENLFTGIVNNFEKWMSVKRNYPVFPRKSDVRSEIPLLCVMQDAVLSEKTSASYKAVLSFINDNKSMVKLVSFPGVSAVDFSDVPEKYPIISSFYSRMKMRGWDDSDCVQLTSKLILNFMYDNF
jgi:hypothetical protein